MGEDGGGLELMLGLKPVVMIRWLLNGGKINGREREGGGGVGDGRREERGRKRGRRREWRRERESRRNKTVGKEYIC